MLLRLFTILVLASTTVSAGLAATAAARKPNVILIMADDFGDEPAR